ncbi:hypothetical protein C0J52_10943 [Blattella germanica]|nr:hypothetical protein C0J52_10943 [Blattella germanica]
MARRNSLIRSEKELLEALEADDSDLSDIDVETDEEEELTVHPQTSTIQNEDSSESEEESMPLAVVQRREVWRHKNE